MNAFYYVERATRRFQIFLFLATFVSLSACKKNAQQPTPETTKEVQSLSFKMSNNPGLLTDLIGDIKGDTIFVNAFAGTNIKALVADFSIKGQKVTVNGETQQSGVTTVNFSDILTYTVVGEDGRIKNYFIKFTDNGIPALYVNTTNGVAVTSKEVYLTGTIKTVSNFNVSSATLAMEVKGHGNSTWGDFAKKPYKIKLDKKTSILGMPATKSWILLANAADKSLIRNELALALSRSIGRPHTVDSRYVELFLNGEYRGSYQLAQQVKEGIVGIEDQKSTSTTLPDISGGYLIEQDLFPTAEPVYFRTAKNMPFVVKYPDEDVNQQQKDYIKAHFQKIEDALFATTFTDPVNGYRKYFDVDGYVDYYLINEVIGNPDVFRSTYMYKKRNDDKVYIGPIWDFDKAANNDNRLGDQVNGLMLTSAFEPKIWIKRMMQDPNFRQKIRSRWNELKPKIMAVPGAIVPLAKKLAYSQVYNFTMWDILKKKSYLELQVNGSYDGEIQYLKTFMTNHITWLDSKFNSAEYQ
ncbi:CotH kinase family protein [Mucilaginibacter antarcticus]|uniref:CotH kinase family protein n=1 Tax=Mucilaginibacter antarcticus TaxID=1855725 RepID=A0ABW5XK99_9SPHI